MQLALTDKARTGITTVCQRLQFAEDIHSGAHELNTVPSPSSQINELKHCQQDAYIL